MNQETLGLIRHALTTVGGGLVTKGLISGDSLNDAAGAIAIIVGIVWSILHKQSVKKQIENASAPFPENH